MRQFAAATGISNPYLSQIERGLRAPSDAVLKAIAESLRTTAEGLLRQAGIAPEAAGESPVVEAIRADQRLTAAQRRTVLEVYRAFTK